MKIGLTSISFRSLKVHEIIALAKQNSLDFIEWGGDVHVPMGNVKLARKVKKMTETAGLKCLSYGSYFGTVYEKRQKVPLNFKKVLQTAKALGATTVRVWPGWPSQHEITLKEEKKSVVLVRQMCDLAKKYGMSISFECHMLTLTDDFNRSIEFIKRVNRKNLKMYWQPNPSKSFEYNLKSAKALNEYVTNIHVFNWHGEEKAPLKDAFDEWTQYCDILKKEDRIFLLEFMPDNEPKSLKNEAHTLYSLLK